MFNPTQIKFPPVAGMAVVAGLLLTACGQTPAAVTAGTQTVAKSTQTVQAQTRYDIKAIERNIKQQLEKHIPDLSITISDLNITIMPAIAIYPPPPAQFQFTALETIVGFAGPQFAQRNRIEGTYDPRTGKAVVYKRVQIPVYHTK
jgi:hypothetical protein